MNTDKRTYYGGNASNLGIVTHMAPTTFKEFIDQVLGLPVALNVTRAQYWKMDKAKRGKAKRVPFVTPAKWSGSGDIPRKVENMDDEISLLCIDLDDPTTAMPYYSSPQTLETHLDPFGFALYRTASSTPKEPRLRLMVDTTDLPHERYGEAIEDIARRIGLPLEALTRESKQPFMPMFVPTIFADEKDNAEHPLLYCAHVDREPYTESSLDSSEYGLLGDGSDARFKTAEVPIGMGAEDPLENLDYLRAPLMGCEIKDVEGALEYCDPDMPYAQWIAVAAGLKHQFPREPERSQARDLFFKWSEKGTKFAGIEDVEAKWKSFNHTPKGRLPVTIRTVFHEATEKGWSPIKFTEKTRGALLRWLAEDSSVPESRFLQVAIARIAAIPMLTYSDEEGLFREVIQTAAKRYKIKVGITSLRKDLKKARSMEKEKRQKSKIKKSNLPPWAMNVCYVEGRDVFVRTTTKTMISPKALDNTHGRDMLKITGQNESDTMAERSKPEIRPSDFLLNVLQIPVVYDTTYDPREVNSETIVKIDGIKYLNTYRRDYPEQVKKQAEYAASVFNEHLEKLLKEKEYRVLVLDYLSYLVQERGAKVRWAILLQGAQGCGKTFFLEAMKAVLGPSNAATVGPEALNSQWTEWATGHQVVALEEIRVAGHNRHDIMNKLKGFISNKEISINQRFKDTRNVQNYTNYLIFTNHHDAVVLSDDDRRYCVLKARQQSRHQVNQMGGTAYFQKLFDMLETHAAGLRFYLMNRKISDSFDPDGQAPRTTYSDEMIRDSKSPIQQMVVDALDDYANGTKIVGITPEIVLSKSVSDLMDIRGLSGTGSQIAHALREEGYFYTGRHRLKNGDRHGIWVKHGTNDTDDTDIVDRGREMAEKIISGESIEDEFENIL